jgi:hypothetical protein
MDNTDLIQFFRAAMNPEAVLLPLHEGPAELGGPQQQRLTTHFKLCGNYTYEVWAPQAMKHLAEMTTHSFPSGIQFYRLESPEDNIIEDPEICIREFRTQMKEEWSEPAEDLNEKQRAEFVPRQKWVDHTRVTFEVIFQFGQKAEIEYPETD